MFFVLIALLLNDDDVPNRRKGTEIPSSRFDGIERLKKFNLFDLSFFYRSSNCGFSRYFCFGKANNSMEPKIIEEKKYNSENELNNFENENFNDIKHNKNSLANSDIAYKSLYYNNKKNIFKDRGARDNGGSELNGDEVVKTTEQRYEDETNGTTNTRGVSKGGIIGIVIVGNLAVAIVIVLILRKWIRSDFSSARYLRPPREIFESKTDLESTYLSCDDDDNDDNINNHKDNFNDSNNFNNDFEDA